LRLYSVFLQNFRKQSFMRLSFYGHSCFALELGGKRILIDPFITPNPLARHIDISRIEADYILVSHGHSDHIADCVALAAQTGATVIANFEVCNWLAGKGVAKYHPMNTGGKKEFEWGTVRCTSAIHSSGLPDGSYGGNPMGFLITSAEGALYFSGDTALTTDMQLVPGWAKLDFSIFPIGDNFTMGYEDAIEAARMVQCTTVVGVHYDTFPYIVINHKQAQEAFASAGIRLLLPAIGETIEL
jgi:L-ascorbate metabolism protein UlaG (beta-lactamase superfamily)